MSESQALLQAKARLKTSLARLERIASEKRNSAVEQASLLDSIDAQNKESAELLDLKRENSKLTTSIEALNKQIRKDSDKKQAAKRRLDFMIDEVERELKCQS